MITIAQIEHQFNFEANETEKRILSKMLSNGEYQMSSQYQKEVSRLLELKIISNNHWVFSRTCKPSTSLKSLI